MRRATSPRAAEQLEASLARYSRRTKLKGRSRTREHVELNLGAPAYTEGVGVMSLRREDDIGVGDLPDNAHELAERVE